ncbi:MAG: hypothetical protein HY331_18325 [Chloroflexi bacterium]|nr:hypothetical protein [Chloroflexota bacterium]
MDSNKENRTLSFAADAQQVLRQAQQIAGDGRVGLEHFKRAVEQPVVGDLPPATLRSTPAIVQIIERANSIAADQAAVAVTRAHLYEAFVEEQARANGLDLDHLRTIRCWSRRRSPVELRLRRCQDGTPTIGNLLKEETSE